MTIISSPAASMPSAPTGTVVYFFNTSDMGKLYYITDSGTYYPASQGMQDMCACAIGETWIQKASCAMERGMITVAEYNSIINSGILVTSSSTDDGAGNRTSTFAVSSKSTVQSVSITEPTDESDLTPLATGVAIGVVLPISAPQAIGWSSSNPLVISIDMSGNYTVNGVAGQTCTITAFSLANPTVFATTLLTVQA